MTRRIRSVPRNPTLLLLIVFFTAMTAFTAAAQTSDTPIVVPVPADSADALFFEARDAEKGAYFASLDILNLNVVYFTVPNEDIILGVPAARSLNSALGAVVADSWQAVLDAVAESPIHVLIVHESAYDNVDLDWTRSAYRSEVLIVGLDMSFEQIQEMTGDWCEKDPNPGLADLLPHRYTYLTLGVRLDRSDLRDSAISELVDNCRDGADLPGRVDIHRGTVDGFPTTEIWVRSLESNLMSDYGQHTFWHLYPEWYSNTREIPERLQGRGGN